MKNAVLLAFVLPILLGVGTASAQVNTEKLRTGAPTPGFHGSVDGSVLLKRGNVRLLSVSTAARIEYNVGIHTPYLIGSFSFGQKGDDDDVYINNGFGHLRWTAMWHPYVGTELFSQVQFNEFLRLKLRVLGGAGVRVAAVTLDTFELSVGTGYMVEFEDLSIDASNAHPQESLNHRWTSYVTFKVHIQDYMRLVSITYVQPRFDELSDMRVLQDADLEVDVFKYLSLILGVSVAYDSDPPDGVETTDITFAPKLRVKW